MRAVNGHDLGADDPSADPNLDHFTVDRFSWLVLCLGKLEFRFAQLPRFDVPDVLPVIYSVRCSKSPIPCRINVARRAG
jgi:hypothetical protein